MEAPKKWWWVVLVVVPIILAVIGILPLFLEEDSGEGGETTYFDVAGDVYTGQVAFNSVTVIVEQVQQRLGEELPEGVLEMLREATALLNSGEFERAIPLLQSAEEAAPVPAVFSNLGAAYLATGNRERAREYFEQAPDEPAARFNLEQLEKMPVNVAELASGARLVNFTSQYDNSIWAAANILDGKSTPGWCSVDASFPQTFIVELPGEFLISRLSFDNNTQEADNPGISAKDIEIYVSLEAEDSGYQQVGTFNLRKGEIAQGFRLDSPVRARWIKINILSNHGNARYTELMEFRAIGRPSE